MSKPKLPEGEARTELLVIRLTPTEVARLRCAAQDAAPSVWARRALLRAAARRQPARKRAS